MPLICVCSPKGGVGKTTLAANLAYSLARTGSKVLALDFDVQNALRLHFGVPLNDERGYVAKALELHDWSQCVLSAGSNIFVLPYGEVSEAQRQAFDEQLTHNDHFLQRGLSALLNYPGLITIADMPSTFARAKGADGAGGPASYPAAGGYRLDVDHGARRKAAPDRRGAES